MASLADIFKNNNDRRVDGNNYTNRSFQTQKVGQTPKRTVRKREFSPIQLSLK